MEKLKKINKNLLEDISPIENNLENFNLVYFKDITLVRNFSTEEIRFFDENYGDELRNDMYQYIMTSDAVMYQHDYELVQQLDYYEKKLFDKAKSIENYRNLSSEDIILINKVFSLRRKNFEIPTRSVNFREMIIFLKFINNCNSELYKKFVSLKNNYKDIGIRTFLSLEHGGSDMGQKILDLGEQLPPETASKIFAKYAEIIDSVEKILDSAQNNFKSTIDTKPELLQSIEQSLYKRGADLLSQFHANSNQNPEEIIEELDRINADTITTLSIFKYAAKFGNKLPLEDISGAEFSKKSGSELSLDEIDEMEHIYQANWKNYGNQELIQSVIHKFKDSLIGDNAKNEQVYTFKKNNQINAFVKFSELHPGVKYASALNVDQYSKGFGLGETMMDETLYREAQENILIATCDPYNDSNMRYMEKGFVGTGFTGDNPPVLNITWNESMNNHIQSKHISSDDLVIMYLKQQIPNNFTIRKGKSLQDIHTDIPSGKSLTRCFRDPLHTGDWYTVYESIPMDYETKIKTTE
jgi:hypothetical protein